MYVHDKIQPELVPFQELVTAMAPSHAQHQQALDKFDNLKHSRKDPLSLRLAQLTECSTIADVRARSATLLWRLFEENLVQPEFLKQLIKIKILRCAGREPCLVVMKSLCDTISKVFNLLNEEKGWPHVLDFVRRGLSNGGYLEVYQQEAALLIVRSLRPYKVSALISPQRLFTFLGDKYSGNVFIRAAAFGVAISYIVLHMRVGSLMNHREFRHLVQMMDQVLLDGLRGGREDMTREALSMLLDWVRHPWFDVDGALPGLHVENLFFDSAFQIAVSRDLIKQTKLLAIQVVLPTVGKQDLVDVSSYHTLFEDLISMLLDIENEHQADDEYDDANYGVLLTCLDRLATVMSWEKVLVCIEPYLTASEWQKHVAAIVALAQTAKGLAEENLGQLVTMVLGLAKDSHQRVRSAAINATNQMSNSFDRDSQCERVLPALATAIHDFQNPQVQECALSAMVNISYNCSPAISIPCLGEALTILLQHFRDQYGDIDSHHTGRPNIPINEPTVNLVKQLRLKLPRTGEAATWKATWNSVTQDLHPTLNLIIKL